MKSNTTESSTLSVSTMPDYLAMINHENILREDIDKGTLSGTRQDSVENRVYLAPLTKENEGFDVFDEI